MSGFNSIINNCNPYIRRTFSYAPPLFQTNCVQVPALFFRRGTHMTIQLIYLFVKNQELMIRYFRVYRLTNLVSLILRNLNHQQLHLFVISYNGVFLFRIGSLEVLCQRFNVVLFVLHEQEQTISYRIWHTWLTNNWDFFSIFSCYRGNNISLVRQFAVIANYRSNPSIIINNPSVGSCNTVNWNYTIFLMMSATSFT